MREGGTEGRRPTPGTHRFYAARHADTMRYRASERISFRNPLSLNSSSLPRRGERTEESAGCTPATKRPTRPSVPPQPTTPRYEIQEGGTRGTPVGWKQPHLDYLGEMPKSEFLWV